MGQTSSLPTSSEMFPLLKLPSLAMNEVFKSMDPMELLVLCKTPIKPLVGRAIRNYPLQISESKNSNPEHVKFGFGGKRSIITLKDVKRFGKNKKKGFIYRGGIMYYRNHSKILESICECLITSFDSNRVKLHLYELTIFDLCDSWIKSWPFRLLAISASGRGGAKMFLEKNSCSLMGNALGCYQAIVDPSNLTDKDLNIFLKKWAESKSQMELFDVHSMFDLEAVLDGFETFPVRGADKERVRSSNPEACYTIRRARDNARALVGMDDNVFRMTICTD